MPAGIEIIFKLSDSSGRPMISCLLVPWFMGRAPFQFSLAVQEKHTHFLGESIYEPSPSEWRIACGRINGGAG
jgi:hypothetical protein